MSNDKDILQALQQLKATGASIGPFSVPKDYFPELENQIIEKVLGESVLSDEGKNPTFKAPDHYFDNLEKAIIKRTKPAGRLFFLKKWQQIAAVAIGGMLLLGGIYYFERETPQQPTVQNTTIHQPAIQDLSVTELAAFAEEGATAEKEVSGKKNTLDSDQLFQEVSSQDLQNFLSENTANDSDLF